MTHTAPDGAEPDETDERDAAARRRDVVVAGHQGDAAIARSALSDPASSVREAGLGALERCNELTTHELAAALSDDEISVRRRAALIAARRSDVADNLRALLDDTNDTVVEVAAFAWGERSDGAHVVDRLSEVATTHEDALCREAAVAALGSIGDPAGLPAVLVGCADRATVRRRAVLALAAFDGPDVTAMLKTCSEDRDLQVRQSAADLLEIELEG